MTVVVSLGGSFLFEHPEKISELNRLTKKVNEQFIVVCGGGMVAREYINFASGLDLDSEFLHKVGIELTRVNAMIIAKKLGGGFYNKDPRRIELMSKVTVTGGYKPGWTTDTCAAYAAVASKSDILFNLSKEKNVYDKDPSEHRNAKPIKSMLFSDLYRLTKGSRKPGMNFIFDPLAGKICEKNEITVVVTDDPLDISNYLNKKEVDGTIIKGLNW